MCVCVRAAFSLLSLSLSLSLFFLSLLVSAFSLFSEREEDRQRLANGVRERERGTEQEE